MHRAQQPTAYWIIRDSDDVRFNLVHSKEKANERAEYYRDDFNEDFRVVEEYRTEIKYNELPESWGHDWHDRVPYSIRVVENPEIPINP